MKNFELGISSLGHILDFGRSKTYDYLINLLIEATEECFNFAEERDIKRVEILVDPPDFINIQNRQKFIDLCHRFPKINKQVHGPFMDMNLSSLNQYISNASVESYIEVAKLCREIQAQFLTIHPGLPNFLIASLSSHNKDQLIQSIIKLLDATVNIDSFICIENMPRKVNILNKEMEIEKFLMNVNREDLYITWDTSHSWTCDVNLDKFWEKFHHIIKNIHLVDNLDQNDDPHPALGTGKINFNEIFSILEKFKYDGPVIIELSSSKDLQTSLDFISNFL